MSSDAFALVKSRRMLDGQVVEGGREVRVPAQLRKALLLLLAEYADERWSCFPGQEMIADDLDLSERTVRRGLASLEADGLVKRRHRHRGDGTRTSDRFVLVQRRIRELDEHESSVRARARRDIVAVEDLDEDPDQHAATVAGSPGGPPATVDNPTGHSGRDYRPPVAAHELLEEPPENPLPPEAASRRLEQLASAVADACGLRRTELTTSAAGQLGVVAAQLYAVGATSQDIDQRADAYRHRWPDIALTPMALAKHWPSLGAPPDTRAQARPGPATLATPLEQAASQGRALALTDLRVDELPAHTPWDPDLAEAFLAAFHDTRARRAS